MNALARASLLGFPLLSTLTAMAQLGSSASNPGVSAKDIKLNTGTGTSGLYWIRPETTAFQAYADMSTAGGGWTLGVSSVTGSEPQNASMTQNLGSTPTPTVAGVLDLSRLAIDNTAAIRFRIDGSLGTFDGYFTGNFQTTTIPSLVSWTLIQNTGTAQNYLSALYGTGVWNATSAAGIPWYQSSGNYGTTPTLASNGLTQGPVNSGGATISSFQIYVRETGTLTLQPVPEVPVSGWLAGGAFGTVALVEAARRRRRPAR